MTFLHLHRLLVFAFVIIPAGLFALAAVQSRSEVLREGEDVVARTAAVMREQAQKVFETGELALARVDDRISALNWEQIAAPETSEFLARLTTRLEQVVSIWITDANGRVRAGSQPWDMHVSLANREFFEAQRERDVGTYISAAFRGRATGLASIAISRRRFTPDGRFDGIIHVSLSPEYFARFYAEAAPPLSHAAVLLRADGSILARQPYREINSPLGANSPLMQQIAIRPAGGRFTGISSLDGTERIYAYQKVGSYPVYVGFGTGTTSVLRRWHENLILYGAAAGVACLLLLLTSGLALRGAKAEQTAVRRLQTALDDLRRETTQREAAEQRVREAQKMEAMGQFTGGVAHDFNNLLTAVLGSLQLLRKRLPASDKQVMRLLDNAIQASERGAALTQRLLAFGRRQALRPEAVDVPTLVRGMSDLLRSSLGAGVQIETHFPITLAPVYVDANQLELALLNLAVNARDAIAGSGRLIIAAREETGETENQGATGKDAIEKDAAGKDAIGTYVVLSVADTGVGMDAATLARATEPFFTTKGVGKGTGLGLSMVHGLVAQSGGKLLLRSAPGAGTAVELWLPVVAAAVPPEPVARADRRPASVRSRTVLMVDDDALVLASGAAMLEDMGHSVVEASSAREALEVLHAGAKVDLVVADQSMPDMTGIQLATTLRRLLPDLPLLLATGYAEQAEVIGSGLPVLAKPFDQASLMEAIENCLEIWPAGKAR